VILENEIDARINNVILFLKDVPYNNRPNTTKVQNPFKFVLSTEAVIRDWADQYVEGQLKSPNGVDFPCKDAGIFGMINCVNSKFDLLQATIDAIEANPPTPFSFKPLPTPPSPSSENAETPCLDELSAMAAKGYFGEGPSFFSEQAAIVLESGNEQQACELLAMSAGAS